jgi:XTP/dITP diphosphohydrolase
MPDPLRLWLASTSSGKLREFREAGLRRGVRVDALPRIGEITPCVENGSTFAANARKKALYYSSQADGLVLAEDSGLCVNALGGAPGVFSARFAGEGATDSANNSKLLEELRRVVGPGNWSGENSALPRTAAHYVCVIALAERGRILREIAERADGFIISQPRGSGGFGYDPYFFYPPLGSTFAELSPEEKFAVSHRGAAFRKLLGVLQTSRDSTDTATSRSAAEHRGE